MGKLFARKSTGDVESTIYAGGKNVTEALKACKIAETYPVPVIYEKPISNFTNRFIYLNQIDRHTGGGSRDNIENNCYEMDYAIIYNRISYLVGKKLETGKEIRATNKDIEAVVTADVNNSIMLNRDEERTLIACFQNAKDYEKDDVLKIAVTFFTPRIKVVFDKYLNTFSYLGVYDDACQSVYMSLVYVMSRFDFNLTTAGLTPQYLNPFLHRGICDVIFSNRSIHISQDTWGKVMRYVSLVGYADDCKNRQMADEPIEKLMKEYNIDEAEAMLLVKLANGGSVTRSDLVKTYKTAQAVVDVMLANVDKGDMVRSLNDRVGSPDNEGESEFGELIAATDNPYDSVELDMVLKEELTPLQKDIIKLKLAGYSQEEIAAKLEIPTKRIAEYQYKKAKKIIADLYGIDLESDIQSAKVKKQICA